VLAPGKETILANTAELLRAGEHHGYLLMRAWQSALLDVGRRLGAPRLASAELVSWLDATARADPPGATRELAQRVAESAASKRIAQSEVVALSREIHNWRNHALDGSQERQRNRFAAA
jgi:hypothetical protein